jgi:hypothetical protein
MKQLLFPLAIVLLVISTLSAQETAKALTFSGYAEMYYAYDFNQPADHTRPPFVYSFNRHNEVNLNIGFLKATYQTDRVRGNLALMAGTYAEYNLAAESDVMQHVYEANAGFKISKNHNLWFDAGIMPSHIGSESAEGRLCWNLTRSMSADNSPYFETGAKVGYTSADEQWYAAVMYLNGWQRIRRPDFNQTPAFGTQLTFKPNGNTMLNWSTFVGNDFPEGDERWRFFNNFYGIFQFNDAWGLTAGFDVGIQEKGGSVSGTDMWYTPTIMGRYTASEHWRWGARVEYYNDENDVIIATNASHGFQVLGYSLNVDYLPAPNVMVRLEAKNLNSMEPEFVKGQDLVTNNAVITSSISIAF